MVRNCVADALRVHRDDPEDGRPAPSAPPAADPPVNVAVLPPPRPCPPGRNSRREIEERAEEIGLEVRREDKTGVTKLKKVIPDEEEAAEDPLLPQWQSGASALSLAGAAAALAMDASLTHKIG